MVVKERIYQPVYFQSESLGKAAFRQQRLLLFCSDAEHLSRTQWRLPRGEAFESLYLDIVHDRGIVFTS